MDFAFAQPILRALLAITSLLGIMATAALTGQMPDISTISGLLTIVGEAALNAYLAHAFYSSAFRR